MRSTVAMMLLMFGCVADQGATSETSQARAIDDEPIDPGGGGDPGGGVGTGGVCDDPHVVYFRTAAGVRYCSGVAIAPDLVMTAAHCVLDGAHQPRAELAGLTVGVGGAGCSYGTTSIQSFKANPDFGTGEGADVALVKLRDPLTGMSPVILSTPSVNASITVTGFGFNMSDGQTERCTSGTISAISGNAVTLDMGTSYVCEGDSGGAVFETGSYRLVGLLTGGETAHTGDQCAHTGVAGANWAWVNQTRSDMSGATTVSCTSGATHRCKLDGAACPTGYGDCVWGQSTCTNGAWSTCAPNPVMTWNATTNSCTCTQTCPAGQFQSPTTCECRNTCGDGQCDIWESSATCPGDCTRCGDGVCTAPEIAETCPQDCGGGSTCICGYDCPPSTPGCGGYCGDGHCDLITEDSTTCPFDCGGGSTCICGYDCPPNTPGCAGYCGDGQCDLITEDSTLCPADCGGGGGDWNPCWSPYDSFWLDAFGDDFMAAYESYCGVR